MPERREPADVDLIVLTHNEELNLGHCLASVAGLVRSIFVVDSGSTDRTAEIAAGYGAKVVTHEFTTQARQFNWALDNLPLESDWVLRLDADEYVLPELKEEIREVLPTLAADVTGLYMNRRMIFLGRWIRHGGYYPAWILRLFRRGKARSEEAELNEHIVLLEGRAEHLRHDFVDHRREGLRFWTLKHEGYAERQARFIMGIERHYDEAFIGARLTGGQAERKRWLMRHVYGRTPLFVRAALYFLYRYVVRLGFLDGVEGLVYHFLHGCWYPFYTDAKIYEARRGAR